MFIDINSTPLYANLIKCVNVLVYLNIMMVITFKPIFRVKR